jgi:hypothetical protein
MAPRLVPPPPKPSLLVDWRERVLGLRFATGVRHNQYFSAWPAASVTGAEGHDRDINHKKTWSGWEGHIQRSQETSTRFRGKPGNKATQQTPQKPPTLTPTHPHTTTILTAGTL